MMAYARNCGLERMFCSGDVLRVWDSGFRVQGFGV